MLSDREKARKAVEVLEGFWERWWDFHGGTGAGVLSSKGRTPSHLLHRFRACCCACEFEGAAENLDKATEEVKVKVEKARAKVEEEERVAGIEKELDGVQKQIPAHEGR